MPFTTFKVKNLSIMSKSLLACTTLFKLLIKFKLISRHIPKQKEWPQRAINALNKSPHGLLELQIIVELVK